MASHPDESETIERARAALAHFLREGRRRDDVFAAIRIWKGLIPLMPGSAEPHAAIGELCVELGLLPEAREHLLAAAETDVQAGDLLRAERALRRIVDLDPADLKTRAKLADLCRKSDRREIAVEQHLAIARELAAKGHPQEAIAVLDRGLATWGGEPELQRARDALVRGDPSPWSDDLMALRYFQLLEIFEEEPLDAVLDRPTWTARYPDFAREWGSPQDLVWSRVVVPAEIVRVLARECPCRLHFWAEPEGDTLHLGGEERGPAPVRLSTERAFEEFGADAVSLAVEYGRSRKGELDRRFRRPPSPLVALWDVESARPVPDLDRLVAAGRSARLEKAPWVEDQLWVWLATHSRPADVDTASCFLIGYWSGAGRVHPKLVDALAAALELPGISLSAPASAVIAIGCVFNALDEARRARIRAACARLDPAIREGRGSAVPAILDAILGSSA